MLLETYNLSAGRRPERPVASLHDVPAARRLVGQPRQRAGPVLGLSTTSPGPADARVVHQRAGGPAAWPSWSSMTATHPALPRARTGRLGQAAHAELARRRPASSRPGPATTRPTRRCSRSTTARLPDQTATSVRLAPTAAGARRRASAAERVHVAEAGLLRPHAAVATARSAARARRRRAAGRRRSCTAPLLLAPRPRAGEERAGQRADHRAAQSAPGSARGRRCSRRSTSRRC